MADATIVFIDIAGSTEIFDWLGNGQATAVITRTTQWIGKLCEAHGGRVIQFLGDGVLVLFVDNAAATEAAVDLQLQHTERQRSLALDCRIKLKVGIARGDVVEQDGHCFGDVVNVASGLSDLAGPEQILASDGVTHQIPSLVLARTRKLGSLGIRGRTEPCVVHQIDWQREDPTSSLVTVQAFLDTSQPPIDGPPVTLSLSWQQTHTTFTAADLPLYLGRVNHAQFVVNVPWVSRLHAKVFMRADQFILEDVSTFGTAVWFEASDTKVALRRQECVLAQEGAIALGATFDEVDVPVVRFTLGSPIV